MNVNQIAQNKRETTEQSWHVPYSPKCICAGCQSKPYWDGEIYYSCCLSCLRQKNLGPFKLRVHIENYSTLFWMSDWENANSRKEIA